MAAFKGQLEQTPIEFISSEGVDFGGVLFLLPSLIATGLLSYQNHYTSLSGYYDLDIIILSLSFDGKQINSEWIEKDKYLESNKADEPDVKS